MYVPFGKSVGDVTFRFSLRHHFLPRLKKTMEHNLRSTNTAVLEVDSNQKIVKHFLSCDMNKNFLFLL